MPVISYDRLILNADVDYYVSFDNEQVGKLQGQALLDKLTADGNAGKTIVMINGSPTDNNATLFKKGAHSVLDGKVKIGAEYDTPDWSPDKAQTEMDQAITKLGKTGFVGVYCANDGTGGGAIAAMKGAGIDPEDQADDRPGRRARRHPAHPAGRAVHDRLQGDQARGRGDRGTRRRSRQGRAGVPSSMTLSKVNNGTKDVPSVLLTPVAVTKDNIKTTVVADGFWTADADPEHPGTQGGRRGRRTAVTVARTGHERDERSTPPLLSLKGVSKAFGANQALTGVDFEVDAGEVVALVGDNGAGKSTLVKAIAGVQLCDEGTFFFGGKPVKITSPRTRRRSGSRPSTRTSPCATTSTSSPTSTSAASCSRRAPRRAAYFIDETAMEQSALELLDSLAVTTIKDVRVHVGSLSGGQRQAVAIARSLLGEPSVVLLDEPTAALGVSQTEQVLKLIRTLRERGLGVVVISHNLENVFAVADRIIVLRLGRRAATFDVRGVSREDVVAAITGAEFGVWQSAAARRTHERRSEKRPSPCAAWARCSRRSAASSLRARPGSLLVLLMVAVIWTFFQFQNDRFLSPGNLTNLMLQQAAVATISIGVVLILLLGRDRPVGRAR